MEGRLQGFFAASWPTLFAATHAFWHMAGRRLFRCEDGDRTERNLRVEVDCLVAKERDRRGNESGIVRGKWWLAHAGKMNRRLPLSDTANHRARLT